MINVKKALIAGLTLLAFSTPAALAAGAAKPLEKGKGPLPEWSFEGPFGKFDKVAMQRGYQVYREACASCHGMELLSFRNLSEPGGPYYYANNPSYGEDLVKAFAAEYIVSEIDTETGDIVERPGRPSDRFVNPFPNPEAAAASNGGAAPPDLSVIIKARPNGADYVYRLLTGYPYPEDFVDADDGSQNLIIDDDHSHGVLNQPVGIYYNPYFPGDTLATWDGDPRHAPYGGYLAMAPQLSDNKVTYEGPDAPQPTKEQLAEDLVYFLAWASEPKQENRKSLGLAVLLYLFILAILVYFSYKAIWRNVKH